VESDCVFCRIARGELPAKILFRDDDVLAFSDVHPIAPVHVLVVPVRHVPSLAAIGPEDERLLGRLLAGVRRAAEACGVLESGFKTIVNTGRGGGQTVPHLHFHVIAGREMKHL
jgi:histidine triad (HIT) family protein